MLLCIRESTPGKDSETGLFLEDVAWDCVSAVSEDRLGVEELLGGSGSWNEVRKQYFS